MEPTHAVWIEEKNRAFPVAVVTLCDGSVLVESVEQPFFWWAIGKDEDAALFNVTVLMRRVFARKEAVA